MAKGFRAPRDIDEAMDTIRKLPSYARLVWALARDPRVPTRHKLLLAGIAGYLALPFDFIPDFIPVVGQLDDLAVLLFGLDLFIRSAPKEVVDEHLARIARNEDLLTRDIERAEGLLGRRAAELRATLDRIRSRDREGGSE